MIDFYLTLCIDRTYLPGNNPEDQMTVAVAVAVEEAMK